MGTYEEQWAYLFEGHNASRAERWKLVRWEDIQPGDVLSYVDTEGRARAHYVDHRDGDVVVTRPSTYGKHVMDQACSVHNLSGEERSAFFERDMMPPPAFRYAERLRRKKRRKKRRRKRPFRPLTL